MSLTKDFVANVVSKRIVFTEQDYVNFMNSCRCKVDIIEFKKLKNDLKRYNYKISNSFFGKEYIHPEDINPYVKKYDLSNIINELKIKNEKINAKDKLDKILNYVQFVD